MKNTTIVNALIIALLLFALVPLRIDIASAQEGTETPTPAPSSYDYVDINGRQFGIQRAVTIGDIGLSIIGLAILATLFIYVSYRIVVDKLS